jgi:hypothetical protein
MAGAALACGSCTNSAEQNRVVTIDGHVFVNGSSHTPVAGATVGTSLDSVRTTTDNVGHFHLATATAGNYCCTPYTITVGAAGFEPLDATHTWGDNPSDQVLWLAPSAAVSVVTIEGRVLMSGTGAGVPDAVVGTSLDAVKDTTDAAGHFLLVTATAANYCCTPYSITISTSGSAPVNLMHVWGDHPTDQTFWLGGSGGQLTVSIEGHVFVSGTSTPVPGAIVGTSLDAARDTTDGAGHFNLVTTTSGNHCCTPYTITISAPGYQPFSGTWVWGDHPTGQTFQLVPAGGLRGF